MKKLIKVEIDRKRWYRGKGDDLGMLRLRNGKQCCLGFAARVLGCRAKEILNKFMPEYLDRELTGLSKSVDGYIDNTEFSNSAAKANDDETITDKQRERQLKTLARKAGFDFQFVN